MMRGGTFVRKLFEWLFYIHIGLIAILVSFLTTRAVLSHDQTHDFQAKTWNILVFSSTACAGIVGFIWQSFTRFNPSRTFQATFWLSPLLSCAFGILLVCVETPGSLVVSVVVIIFSFLQALYACWANPRFKHSSKILTVAANYPPKIKTTVYLPIIVGALYLSLLMPGIGGATATRTKFDILFIFLILLSLTWTMHIIKNVIQVTVSHAKYMKFACSIDVNYKTVVQSTAKYSMGSICIGSILIPAFTVVRGLARAVSLISGDVDEFMFSCADCCSGISSRVVQYANRWGFVHVGVYNKGIVQASMVTWETFQRAGMERLINADLTSSFCFLSGMAAGSICGLVGGIPALFIFKSYAAEVAIYAFLTGYFMNRIAIAWVQACVAAYYVAYAENPQGQQFDATIPNYIQDLPRLQE